MLPSNQNDLFSVFMHLYHFLHILNKYIKKCIVQFCQKHVIDTNYTACTHTGHFSAFWGSFKKVKVADSPKSFTQTFFFFFFSFLIFVLFHKLFVLHENKVPIIVCHYSHSLSSECADLRILSVEHKMIWSSLRSPV